MATGVELLLASICFNATFCDFFYDNTFEREKLDKRQMQLLKDDLNGKHVKIGTYNNFPLSWVDSTPDGKLVGRGLSFILVDILQKRFNFTYDIVLPKKNFEYGGDDAEDSLIGLINNTQVDFGAAFLPTLYDYQSMVEFSTGLDEGIWMMMLKRPKESAAGSGLLAPFEYHVWFLILAAVVSYGPCITLLTRLRSKLVPDMEKHITISPSVWFVYGAFIKQGTTLSPGANTTRVLFATWWLFIILLSAFYTANLTAFLTLSKFTLDIENPQDLYKKNYRWLANEHGTVQFVVEDVNEDLHYLSAMIVNGRAEFRSVSNVTDYLPLVSKGAVLVLEQTAIDHLMYNDYLAEARQGIAETDRCTYVVAPNPFMRKMRAFAYPRNSTFKRLFDPVLTHIVAAGIIKHLLHRDLPSTKICPLDLQSKDRKLQNSDLLMTYLIMVAGLAAAAVTFIGELVIRKYSHSIKRIRPADDNKRKKSKSKKIKWEKTSADSHPPPYESLFGPNSMYKDSEDKQYRIINGREYYEVRTVSGDKRLIPVRTPSALLWNH
uniref:Putative ionotropic receptor 14 n=1 Tax=Conopomorpha sinensis TaxID=940481 RepID=A0A3Q8HDG9_9NEOP|nr:putative ionotropic receptor 14 [Conopomorpha sinensis]